MGPHPSPPRAALTILAAAALLAFAGGHALSPSATTPVAGAPPVATIQELMQSIVDPSADTLWEAVSTEVSAAGTVEHRPADDAAWRALRRSAVLLAEAGLLLRWPDRAVAAPGATLEDADSGVVLGVDAISERVAAQRPSFDAHAAALQAAARDWIAAIDARDLVAYERAGARVDAVCEACHLQFWYPHDRRP